MTKECMKEFLESAGFALLLAGFIALWIFATPDQMSAEYDWVVGQGKAVRNDR